MTKTSIVDAVTSNARGLWLIGAAWILFFGHVFLGGNVFYLDDLKILYYPLETAYAEFQADWSLPLWSHEFGFGHPLLAWGQLGFFTPLHVLLRAFSAPPLVLLQISVASYFLAGLVGMFMFLRQRALEELPAALGAIVFVFSGFTIGHLNHVNFYTGTMVLPWLLLALDQTIQKPALRRAGLLAIAAACIALSAQPQIVLFVFAVAAVYAGVLLIGKPAPRYLLKIAGSIAIAGVLAFGLSSLSILPLAEFLPETERASALPQSELFEFSYPPQHAITLLLPFFYGNHELYWGAKGFQELAAFTGIIPLFLALSALASWKSHKAERVVGVLLVIIAIVFGLGRYSPIYRYLVENHYITSLGVAGRFVMFFDYGVALLAAVGLMDVISAVRNRRLLWRQAAVGYIGVGILLLPFAIRVLQPSSERSQLRMLLETFDASLLMLAGGVALIALAPFIAHRYQRVAKIVPTIFVLCTAATLLIFSWNYNPVTPRAVAFAESPISGELRAYAAATGTPARLYSNASLIQASAIDHQDIRYTDMFSPTFSVYQPLTLGDDQLRCILLPLESNGVRQDTITVGIHTDPMMMPIETVTVPWHLIGQGGKQRVCFTNTPPSGEKKVWISITAPVSTTVRIAMAPQEDPAHQAYLVRTINPTPDQWEASLKPFQILIEPEASGVIDRETAHLARHLQVTAGASSARWIGALSIREFRNLIEVFLANDREAFDGDSTHAIERNRKILDMAGVTHLAQLVLPGHNDNMPAAGFELLSSTQVGNEELRLYKNPAAFPKAFMVPSGIWLPPADETRHALSLPEFDPSQTVYISGPIPPAQELSPPQPALSYKTNITTYGPTYVEIAVETNQPGYLVLNDSTTPQWHTYIDGAPAEQLVANSVFKMAFVPAGSHTVSFRYHSPATELAKKITLASLVGLGAVFLAPGLVRRAARYSLRVPQ